MITKIKLSQRGTFYTDYGPKNGSSIITIEPGIKRQNLIFKIAMENPNSYISLGINRDKLKELHVQIGQMLKENK